MMKVKSMNVMNEMKGKKTMKIIKTMTGLLLVLMLALSMAACGSTSEKTDENKDEDKAAQEQTDSESNADKKNDENKKDSSSAETMVIYFSATGNTEGVAKKIADITGATIYEIEPAEPYSDADLDYNDENSRASSEQNDPNTRPKIGSKDVSLDGCKTIYLGYPIWHGQAPRIMSTFVEKYKFDGITVIPFCTSGSSDIGQSAETLKEQAGSGKWLQGARFDAGVSEDDLKTWIDETK